MPQTDTSKVEKNDADLRLSRPIFVTGYMHSGTTLAQRVLSKHQEVFAGGGETRHFSHLAVIKGKYPDLNDDGILADYVTYLLQVICTGYARVNFEGQEADSLQEIASCGLTSEDIDNVVTLAKNNRDHALLLGTAYDYLTVKGGKERWLDKSPGYVMILDDILELFPGSRAVVLVRDPRDTLASKLRRSQKRGNYDPVWDTISWRAAVRAGESAQKHFPDRVIRVRYEDLVAEPQREFRRICKFLNLEFDDTMLSVDWMNTSIKDLKGPGIGTSAIGKWRKTLPEEDVFISQQLAKNEMADNDYLPEPISPSVRLKSPILFGRSSGEFVARLHKKWSRGGMDHLMNSIGDYHRRFRALDKTDDTGA